ncbi:surface-adhesin E family protein [Caballeronia novacaledonica]|uniref:Surface-adhesin protein E-like domain-containing protein n=1 Tax=Caballeronia novacaledonica TaxID=1544861 RepID=A0AA37IE42_9BURK|nr:surface-adhesin E family protein [Caballeronia novacaledonica]GJH28150.1 hypothetical protein CBA19CS42_26560 [Caballeronia novacaledonica]
MKTRDIISAFVVGVSLLATSATRAEWIHVQDNYAFNTDHFVINGPMRTAFVRLDKPGVRDGKRYAYMVVRQEVDCASWTMSVLSIAKYDSKGKAVDSATIPAVYRKDLQIFPETKADLLAKTVCAISSEKDFP